MRDFRSYKVQLDDGPSSSYQGKTVADPPGWVPRAQREAVSRMCASPIFHTTTQPTQALASFAKEVRSKDGNLALKQQVVVVDDKCSPTLTLNTTGAVWTCHGGHKKRGIHVLHSIHVWLWTAPL